MSSPEPGEIPSEAPALATSAAATSSSLQYDRNVGFAFDVHSRLAFYYHPVVQRLCSVEVPDSFWTLVSASSSWVPAEASEEEGSKKRKRSDKQFPAPSWQQLVFDPTSGYCLDKVSGLYYEPASGLFLDVDRSCPVDAYVWCNLAEAYFPVQLSYPAEEPFPSEDDRSRSGQHPDNTGATSDPARAQHSQQLFALEVVETTDSRLTAASIPLGQTNKNGVVTIGRDKKNTVALSRDIEASSEHARICLESAYWESHVWLVDLGSKNGTFVNGSRVSPSRVESSAHQCELRPDDIVRIGKTSFKLVVEVLPAAQPLPPRVVSNAAIRNQWRLTKEERDEQAQRKKRYADRAAERRVEPAEGVSPIISEAYIPKVSRANPGRKLLERMGWQPGQGLGAEGDGIQRPVLQSAVQGRQGLGFGGKPS